MNHALAADCAARWYGTHESQFLSRDRSQMVDACTTYLCGHFAMTDASARQIAMQALAEIEADDHGISGFIDVDRSSSRLLVLRDSTTRRFHMITLPELFALVNARERAAAA